MIYLWICPFVNLVWSFIMLKALLGKSDCTFKLAITTSKNSVLEPRHDYVAWSCWILIRMRSILYHVILIIYCHDELQMNFSMYYKNLCRSVTEDLNFESNEFTNIPNPATCIQKSKYKHILSIKLNKINNIDLHDCSCITLLSNCSDVNQWARIT